LTLRSLNLPENAPFSAQINDWLREMKPAKLLLFASFEALVQQWLS